MLIGREKELRTLNDTFAQALSGKGSTIFISGEAGLGKTTLILEWQKALPGGCVFLNAICPTPIAGAEKNKIEALHPWRNIFAELHTGFKSILNIEELIAQCAPAWMGMTTNSETGSSLPSRDLNAANQDQIFQQFANLLEKAAEYLPLVLFIEDIEWADESSAELLRYLCERTGNSRIMVVITDGGEDILTVWENMPHHSFEIKNDMLRTKIALELPLKNWSAGDVSTFLSATFPKYSPDTRTETWLAAISGGNPFYITNYITTLHEDGAIDQRGKFTAESSAVHHPISVQMAAQQRIRRLTHKAQYVLGYAAVEGERFNASRLASLTNTEPRNVINGLAEAEQRGIIARIEPKDETFNFSHALFRHALYEELSDPEKESLHREYFMKLTAEWEEATDPEQQSRIAADLLFHAEKCGEYIFGAMVAYATAKALWNIYAEKEALEAINKLFEYGATLEETEPDFYNDTYKKEYLLPSFILHAKIDDTRARYDDALTFYDKAEELANSLGNAHGRIDALNGRANVLMHRADYRELLRQAEANKKVAEEEGYEEGIASATNLLGIASSETGNQQKALECFRAVLAIGEKINDPILQMRALGHIGNVHQALGEYHEALQSFNDVLALTKEHPSQIVRISNLYRKATIYQALGDLNSALACYQASMETAVTIGDRLNQTIALLGIGKVKQDFYDYNGALEAFTECYDISREIGNRRLEQTIMTAIGLGYQSNGDFPEALAWHQKAYRLAMELEFKEAMAFSMANLGFAYKYMERYQNAIIYLEGALKILRERLSLHLGFALVLRETADLYNQQKEYDKALQYLEEAKDLSEKMGYQTELAETYLTMGRVYRNIKAPDRSKEFLERGAAIGKEYNRPDIESRVKGELGLLKEAEGDRDSALQLLHECIEECKTVAPYASGYWEKEFKKITTSRAKQPT